MVITLVQIYMCVCVTHPMNKVLIMRHFQIHSDFQFFITEKSVSIINSQNEQASSCSHKSVTCTDVLVVQ